MNTAALIARRSILVGLLNRLDARAPLREKVALRDQITAIDALIEPTL